jgi:hypothetical protein
LFRFRWASYGSPMPVLDIALFKPLRSCPLLKDVRISTYGRSLTASDQDIEKMVLAWLHLRFFAVFREPRSDDKEYMWPEATLASL